MEDTLLKNKESKLMEDDLIFLMSIYLIAIVFVDVFNMHIFGLECVLAIFNTAMTIYFYYKNRK